MGFRDRAALRLGIVIAALWTSSCAYYLPSSMGGEARLEEAVADPAILRKQSDEAAAAGNPELAYRYLALIRILHPDTPQSREAFPEAVRLFKYLYDRETQLAKYDSIWVTSEPYFLFRWLEQEFAGEAFPQDQMDRLFVRSRASLFRKFELYAQDRATFRRWRISAVDDNGRIESVTGEPAGA